jgi:hypothetical protein
MGSEPRMEAVRWECDVCDFWYVIHGNPTDIKYQEKLKKCQGCTKPQRLDAYKEHWDKRTKER